MEEDMTLNYLRRLLVKYIVDNEDGIIIDRVISGFLNYVENTQRQVKKAKQKVTNKKA